MATEAAVTPRGVGVNTWVFFPTPSTRGLRSSDSRCESAPAIDKGRDAGG